MNGKQLRELRRSQGWNVDQLGRLLKEGLGRGSASSVRNYEKAPEKDIPDDIASFLHEITFERRAAEAGLLEDPPAVETVAGFDAPEDPIGDTAPPPPSDARAAGQPPLSPAVGDTYARVCEELFDMIATGIGLIGAGTGNVKLQQDGRIIHADKQALGRAYGKLARTNETFARMLTGMTASGAWLEVAMVTGITGGKILRNHQPPALPAAEEEEGYVDDGRGALTVVS